MTIWMTNHKSDPKIPVCADTALSLARQSLPVSFGSVSFMTDNTLAQTLPSLHFAARSEMQSSGEPTEYHNGAHVSR